MNFPINSSRLPLGSLGAIGEGTPGWGPTGSFTPSASAEKRGAEMEKAAPFEVSLEPIRKERERERHREWPVIIFKKHLTPFHTV